MLLQIQLQVFSILLTPQPTDPANKKTELLLDRRKILGEEKKCVQNSFASSCTCSILGLRQTKATAEMLPEAATEPMMIMMMMLMLLI
jgi:hypothetical protein